MGFDSKFDGKPLDGSELGNGQLEAQDYCLGPIQLWFFFFFWKPRDPIDEGFLHLPSRCSTNTRTDICVIGIPEPSQTRVWFIQHIWHSWHTAEPFLVMNTFSSEEISFWEALTLLVQTMDRTNWLFRINLCYVQTVYSLFPALTLGSSTFYLEQFIWLFSICKEVNDILCLVGLLWRSNEITNTCKI